MAPLLLMIIEVVCVILHGLGVRKGLPDSTLVTWWLLLGELEPDCLALRYTFLTHKDAGVRVYFLIAGLPHVDYSARCFLVQLLDCLQHLCLNIYWRFGLDADLLLHPSFVNFGFTSFSVQTFLGPDQRVCDRAKRPQSLCHLKPFLEELGLGRLRNGRCLANRRRVVSIQGLSAVSAGDRVLSLELNSVGSLRDFVAIVIKPRRRDFLCGHCRLRKCCVVCSTTKSSSLELRFLGDGSCPKVASLLQRPDVLNVRLELKRTLIRFEGVSC